MLFMCYHLSKRENQKCNVRYVIFVEWEKLKTVNQESNKLVQICQNAKEYTHKNYLSVFTLLISVLDGIKL